MKKVRLILTTSMVALMGLSALTISSCTKDDKDCPVGMEGKNCDEEIRTPMLGTYAARDVDDLDGSIINYHPSIEKNTSVDKVSIFKFGDFYVGQEIVISNVSKSGSNINFSIPSQKPDGDYEVSGSGSFNTSTNTININYSLRNLDGDIYNYTGEWVKQ